MNYTALTNLNKSRKQLKVYKEMLRDMDGVGAYCCGEIRKLGGSGTRARDRMMELIEKRDAVREKLVGTYQTYLEQVECARQELEGINDANVKAICYYRHVKNYSWAEVANQLGGKATADSVKKAHERYIKAQDKTNQKETA